LMYIGGDCWQQPRELPALELQPQSKLNFPIRALSFTCESIINIVHISTTTTFRTKFCIQVIAEFHKSRQAKLQVQQSVMSQLNIILSINYHTQSSHFPYIPLYNSPASIATKAAPAGTPKLPASPWKLLAVALAALSAAEPVAFSKLPVAVADAAVEAWDCVAATLATEAMDAEAEARRGSAAWQ
jgi:hypothetical protein